MRAVCPNGCNMGFEVQVEVMHLEKVVVTSTGQIEDTLDDDAIDTPDPFASDDWECCECGEEPNFIDEEPKKKVK